MDPLSVGLAAGGLFINLIGQQQNAKRLREASDQVDSQIADLTAWRDTEANRPYVDSNLGRGIITKAFSKYKENAQNAQSTAAVTGASDEAVIAQQGKAQQALGDVMSNVAAQGTIREDQIQQQYRTNLSQLLAQRLGLIQAKAQGAQNLATSAGNFLTSIGPSLTSNSGSIDTGEVAADASAATPGAGNTLVTD